MRYSISLALAVLVALPAFAADSHPTCKMRLEKDDRFSRGSDVVVVAAGEKVHDAIAINGNVTIKSGAHVHNAMAAGGTVTVEDGAVVDGDVAVVKGTAKIAPKAVVKGSRIELSDSLKISGEKVDIQIDGKSLGEKISSAVITELRDCQAE